jgi:hypothetical protein
MISQAYRLKISIWMKKSNLFSFARIGSGIRHRNGNAEYVGNSAVLPECGLAEFVNASEFIGRPLIGPREDRFEAHGCFLHGSSMPVCRP